ncbi:hypothetical protein INQ40_12775 [Lysobacter sp. H21R4]|uniref:hypothetical protein n=1 Tax=Lysobacter sp. H21R4 TaxID=2781021 RepID=UPI001888ED5F|nr:hypothetical protein [Lysobacter sp. H21R4]QOY62721.1 hypothetical protein INQ40_12775 [Lysobacter sp. H21R4]
MTELSDRHREYLFEPFERILMVRQVELFKLLDLLCYGLTELTALPELTTALRKPSEAIEQAKQHAELAQREIDRGFSSLVGQSIIVLWGALEALIKDFLVRWLELFPNLWERPGIASLKIRIGDYEALRPEDRRRYVIGEIERNVAAKLKVGAGRFEAVLSELELGGGIDDSIRRDLLELSAVRNVLVHNAGHVDERFMAMCPWVECEPGQLLRPTRKDYRRFSAAVLQYAALIVERAESCIGSNKSFKPMPLRGTA